MKTANLIDWQPLTDDCILYLKHEESLLGWEATGFPATVSGPPFRRVSLTISYHGKDRGPIAWRDLKRKISQSTVDRLMATADSMREPSPEVFCAVCDQRISGGDTVARTGYPNGQPCHAQCASYGGEGIAMPNGDEDRFRMPD